MKLHPAIRKTLGFNDDTPDGEILRSWRQRTRQVCKPCWELKYCPYGPLVENFPLPPSPLKEAKEHIDFLKQCLRSRKLADGRPLDLERKRFFEVQVRTFDENRHPPSIPKIIDEASCTVFGHLCPVFFAAEPFTETKEKRTHSRTIPREVMLKVVRRDGQICQKCHQPVPDNRVEFDHIIPFSKGGTSTVGNLRLLCFDCNRGKGNALTEILSEHPILHLNDIQKNLKKSRGSKRSCRKKTF